MHRHTINTTWHLTEHEKLKAVCNKALNCSTYFIPLRCIILKMMVAFIKNRIKKSTISAMNLCASEGIRNSRPATETVHITQIYCTNTKLTLTPKAQPTLTSLQEHNQELCSNVEKNSKNVWIKNNLNYLSWIRRSFFKNFNSYRTQSLIIRITGKIISS